MSGGRSPGDDLLFELGRKLANERAAGDGTVVNLWTLIRGFEQAYARWSRVDMPAAPQNETFIPLFETLEWAAAVDERLARIWSPPDARVKYLEWSKDLRGLRWARNRVRHDWAIALEVRRRADLVLHASVDRSSVPELEWAWRENLPEARPVREDQRADEPHYRAQLAGQPARLTLNVVRAFFREYERSIGS